MRPVSGFAANLRRVMAERGMTQAELCRRTGIGRATIWNWRNGDAQPTLGALRVLHAALGCTWDELLGVDAYGD